MQASPARFSMPVLPQRFRAGLGLVKTNLDREGLEFVQIAVHGDGSVQAVHVVDDNRVVLVQAERVVQPEQGDVPVDPAPWRTGESFFALSWPRLRTVLLKGQLHFGW